jgi:sec-independent protein translocase protein TatC
MTDPQLPDATEEPEVDPIIPGDGDPSVPDDESAALSGAAPMTPGDEPEVPADPALMVPSDPTVSGAEPGPPAAPTTPPAAAIPPASPTLPSMPLMEHLRELRTRLIYSVGALFVGMMLSLSFSESVMYGLMGVCGSGCCFQAIEPLEKVTTWFRIALILGLVIATPVILYQIVAFVMPALHRHERRYFLLLLPGAGVLFAVGLLFGYYLVLPQTIGFLVGFLGGSTDLTKLGGGIPDESGIFFTCLRISTYISFLTNLLLVIGLAFQTPLVVFLLSKIGLLTPAIMTRYRRHAIVVIAVLAAVLTPTPDPFTMFMVAVPMYILYELGGLMARVL